MKENEEILKVVSEGVKASLWIGAISGFCIGVLVTMLIVLLISCAPVKMVPPASCLNSEWVNSHEAIRQRNEISGQRIKARIEKYGYRDPMKIQLLPSGYPDDQSSWTFHTPQGTVFIKTK